MVAAEAALADAEGRTFFSKPKSANIAAFLRAACLDWRVDGSARYSDQANTAMIPKRARTNVMSNVCCYCRTRICASDSAYWCDSNTSRPLG